MEDSYKNSVFITAAYSVWLYIGRLPFNPDKVSIIMPFPYNPGNYPELLVIRYALQAFPFSKKRALILPDPPLSHHK